MSFYLYILLYFLSHLNRYYVSQISNKHFFGMFINHWPVYVYANILTQLFVFFLLILNHSLYILDTNSLLFLCFKNKFSKFVTCLLTF